MRSEGASDVDLLGRTLSPALSITGHAKEPEQAVEAVSTRATTTKWKKKNNDCSLPSKRGK